MLRTKVSRLAAVGVVAAGIFGGSVVAATSASAYDPWGGAAAYETCPGHPSAAGWLSISNPTHCDRIQGTWHAYYGYTSSDQGTRPAVIYIDGQGVENNFTYADNEVSWCQADLYSGIYGSGSVLHRAALTSGGAAGYAESLGWNC